MGGVTEVPERFVSLIEDDANAFWTPLVVLGMWTPRLMLYVFTMFWSFAAQIYLRFVLIFEEWPWRLARLVAPEESRASKMQVAVDLKKCKRECCVDLGWIAGSKLLPK